MWWLDFLLTISISVLFFLLFLLLVKKNIIRVNDDRYSALEDKIELYKALLEEERRQWEKERVRLLNEIAEAFRKITKLERENVTLKARIEEIEKIEKIFHLPQTPLLLICGDKTFCEKDAIQLNKAKIWYRVLENATKENLLEELARRRQNKDLYPWIHISAHGMPEGIKLSDGVATPEWWNGVLDGISVAFFANCSGAKVGDTLAGLVDYVIVFYGERESELIEQFTYIFWSEMLKHGDAMQAYKICLGEIPSLRRYADIRKR